MLEPERLAGTTAIAAVTFRQHPPVAQSGLQKRSGAGNIGTDEFTGAVNRTVNMRFCGKMEHGIRTKHVECRIHGGLVAYISLEKLTASRFFRWFVALEIRCRPRTHPNFLQRLKITGISKLVNNQNDGIGIVHQMTHQRGAYESGPARYYATFSKRHCITLRQ